MKRPLVLWFVAAAVFGGLVVLSAIRHRSSAVLPFILAAEEAPTENGAETAAGSDADESEGEEREAAEATVEPDGPDEGEKQKDPKPLEWERPRFEERREERLGMVLHQIEKPRDGRRHVTGEKVLDAMRQVPRHKFVRAREQRQAYWDEPLPIDYGQTISQPYIVAFMTELLDLKPGDKVLEIGTGSAYQAAVLSELTPYVYTIEIIKGLAKQAEKRLQLLGYKTVKTKQGDGYDGWEEHAPFDAIIVTAAAGHVPPPLMAQLKPGGTMVIPVGGVFRGQTLRVVSKAEDGRIRTRSVLPVRFVPMTGRVQEDS